MDRVGEWRLIDADSEDEEAKPQEPKSDSTNPDRRLLVAVGLAVLALAGVAIWLTLPQPDVRLDVAGAVGAADLSFPDASTAGTSASAAAEILVDVEGAVAQPGLHRLPADSRVGDAITAAGGYSPTVDISAAAAALNLAERLSDGSKVHVPVLGEEPAAVAPAGSPAGADSPSDGPVDVNHATADELDTLPGIGPVTAEKIISARTEAPFTSVDELLSRGVVGPSTMDKIRDLITALP